MQRFDYNIITCLLPDEMVKREEERGQLRSISNEIEMFRSRAVVRPRRKEWNFKWFLI